MSKGGYSGARTDERAKVLAEVQESWDAACEQGDLELFGSQLAELTGSSPER